jgi:hypothetical protein
LFGRYVSVVMDGAVVVAVETLVELELLTVTAALIGRKRRPRRPFRLAMSQPPSQPLRLRPRVQT